MRDKTRISLFFEDEDLGKQVGNQIGSVYGSRVVVDYPESFETWKNQLLMGNSTDIMVVESSMKTKNPRQFVDEVFELAGERAVLVVGTDSMNKSRFQGDLYIEKENVKFSKTPIKIDDLKAGVSALIEWVNKQKMDESVVIGAPDEFLPMRIRNFYLYKELEYDAYLQITTKKYAIIISRGVRYYPADLRKLTKMQVQYLYLKKEDRLAFMEKTLEKLTLALEKLTSDFDTMFKVQSQSISLIHEYILNIGVTPEVIHLTKLLIEKINSTRKQLGNLELIITRFPFDGYLVSDQSTVVTYVAISIAVSMGWESDIALKKLGLAGILHDCTLINDDLARVYSKDDPNLLMFTDNERKNFLEHPNLSANFTTLFNGFPECDFIVEEHHELPEGGGFPKALSSTKIPVLSAAFALSCHFTSELIQRGRKKEVMLKTLQNFEALYKIGSYKEPFLALKELLK